MRPCMSGACRLISRSKRPGRRSAGSSASGRFVAPMTTTWPRARRPSISERSWPTTRFSTSPQTSERLGAMASISSRKMTLGAVRWASAKMRRRCASLSP